MNSVDACPCGGVHHEVAVRRGRRPEAGVLADLDRAGHLAVAAAGQPVAVVGAVLVHEDRPRDRRAGVFRSCRVPEPAGAKWKTCCWVTVSGGSSTTPSSSGAIHAPAATAITGAVKVPLSVCAIAPSPAGAGSSRVTGVPNLIVGAVGRRQPEHGGHRVLRVEDPRVGVVHHLADPAKSKYGQRSAAASGSSSSAGTPQLVSTSCSSRGSRVAPKSRPPVSVSSVSPAWSSSCRHSSPAAAGQPHVQRVRVGAAEDPGAAVRAAVAVPGLERFEHHDVEAARRRRPGGGRARQAGSDDDQVRACCHQVPSVREPRYAPLPDTQPPRRSVSAKTTMPDPYIRRRSSAISPADPRSPGPPRSRSRPMRRLSAGRGP